MGKVNGNMNNLEFTPSSVKLQDLTKLGEGRQAEIFVWPSGVLKLYRNPGSLASARAEAAAMHAVEDSGIPMPRFLGTVSIEQRPGIIMERLDGPDQLTLLGRKPWTIWSAGKKLGRLHARLHSEPVRGGLRALKESLRHEIECSDRVPRNYQDLALNQLEHLPDGACICHWDFHPGNVIETTQGPKVIDWTSVARGDALADVARTLLIIGSGTLPPGAPFLVRTLTAIGRRVLVWRYIREYRRLHLFEVSKLEAWEFVNAASRLTYGLSEERGHLLALLERKGRKARH